MWPTIEARTYKPILYYGAVLSIIFSSNVYSTFAQNIPQQQQHQTDYVSNSVGANSGEVISGRSPILNTQEPTCEELRAMWRFSKRQSRASEISNELPTYRDPFANNVWDPYYSTMRSLGGGGVRVSSRYRDFARPVYGRVLHKEPKPNQRQPAIGRTRSYNYKELSRFYNGDNNMRWGNLQNNVGLQQAQPPRRPIKQFRFAGGIPPQNNANNMGNKSMLGSNAGQNAILTPQKGSFQRLKELIWTERARQLAQQRKAEEIIARAAILKEIANGEEGHMPRINDRREYNNPNAHI